MASAFVGDLKRNARLNYSSFVKEINQRYDSHHRQLKAQREQILRKTRTEFAMYVEHVNGVQRRLQRESHVMESPLQAAAGHSRTEEEGHSSYEPESEYQPSEARIDCTEYALDERDGNCQQQITTNADIANGCAKKNHCRSQFKCNLCDKIFSSNRRLTVHQRVHDGKKPFQCSTCLMKFGYKQSMKLHVKNQHEKPTNYQCKYCGKCFSRDCTRKDHEATQHNDERFTRFKCNICDKGWHEKKGYNTHQQQHKQKDSDTMTPLNQVHTHQ